MPGTRHCPPAWSRRGKARQAGRVSGRRPTLLKNTKRLLRAVPTNKRGIFATAKRIGGQHHDKLSRPAPSAEIGGPRDLALHLGAPALLPPRPCLTIPSIAQPPADQADHRD